MVTAFISYSWEDNAHIKWAKSLADRLLDNGIEAVIDQYDLGLGERLPQFMEQSISNADYVLIICTPGYKKKADERKGGVGYEGHIISAELYNKGNERKFIPIIRKGTFSTSMPEFLAGKLGIDLTEENNSYEENFSDLLTTLQGRKRRKPPIKSTDMEFVYDLQSTEGDGGEIKILGIVTDEVTVPTMNGTRGSALYKIPFRLSKYPSELWKKLFIQAWNFPPRFTNMHRFGIASVYGDEIILDGTTIEEVRDIHRDTLKLCVETANKQEKNFLDAKVKREQEEENRIQKHKLNVESVSNSISF